MSTYGFETYRANTSLNMSGISACGVFIEKLVINTTSAGSKSYSFIPGAAGLQFFKVLSAGHPVLTVDTDVSGYARINWASEGASGGSVTVLIFAKKLTESATYGVTLRNDNDQVIADFNYPVPQYAGTATPTPTAALSETTPDGYTMHTHNVTIPGSSFDRIILVCAPNNGADVWYSYPSYMPSGQTTLNLKIFAITGSAYQVPTLHVYSLSAPVSAGSTYAIQLSAADTSLVYDSSAENLTATQSIDSSYPAYGSTTTYSGLTVPAVAAILAPVYEITTFTVVGAVCTRRDYTGTVRRSGAGDYQFKQMLMRAIVVATALPGDNYAINTNTFCIVTDVAQLGGSNTPGTPGPPPPPSTYPSYNNPPFMAVYAENSIPEYSVGPLGTDAGPWYNGSGDSSLYEVMATGTLSTAGAGYASKDVWYSLDTNHKWGSSGPVKPGQSRFANLTYQIRIKSNLQVVVNSSFSLEYAFV